MTIGTQVFLDCKHEAVALFDTYKGIEISRCSECKWYNFGEGMWMAPHGEWVK